MREETLALAEIVAALDERRAPEFDLDVPLGFLWRSERLSEAYKDYYHANDSSALREIIAEAGERLGPRSVAAAGA